MSSFSSVIFEGTLGVPYKREYFDRNYLGEIIHDITGFHDTSIIPEGWKESDLVFLNLGNESKFKESDLHDIPKKMIEGRYIDGSTGIIDLRPYYFEIIVQDLLELLEYGTIVTIFLENSNWLILKDENRNVTYRENFFTLIRKITESSLKFENDNLKNFYLVEGNEEDFSYLEKYEANFSYKIIKHNKYFTPILQNRWGKPVGGIFKSKSWTGSLVILPYFNKYEKIINNLISQSYSKLNPKIFETDHSWIIDILLPKEIMITKNIINLEQEIDILKKSKEEYREKHKFLFDLITSDSASLVTSVIYALRYIGFKNVIDVDQGRKGNNDLEEDIRVEENEPNLIFEVKGLKRMSQEEHISQLDKFVTRRSSENPDVDYHGVLYINHQRNLPLYERSDTPFTEKQIQDAVYKNITLIDSKRLFHLLIGKLTYKWDSKIIRDIFLEKGRIKNVPSNYISIGTVKNLVKDKKVILIDLEEQIISNDIIGVIKDNNYFQTSIKTIQLNNQIVNQASTGDGVGIYIEEKIPLSKGQTIYKIEI